MKNELTEILKSDERIINKYKLLSYLPNFEFKKTSKLKEENKVVDEVLESFNVFKTLCLKTNKVKYIYYGDQDSLCVCNLETIMKHIKRG